MIGARRIGSVIADRYRLDGILGRGGMSVVYRATHTLTQREVALKLLEVTEAADKDNFARFLREAQAQVKLQHPNVVEVLDMGKLEDGSLYLALELLRGMTMADLLKQKRRLSAKEALDLLFPIMDAVSAAHRLGLVHRDLKPANIFLSETADRIVPKLLDFGIVKQLGTGMSTTKVGQIIGTPYFMAPEQAEGRAIGPPADVWAMAVVLYTALSGKLPFSGPHHYSVLMAIASGEHAPLDSVAPQVPPALAAVIESALVVDPSARPQDMSEFRAALARVAPSLDGMETVIDAVLEADTQKDLPPSRTEIGDTIPLHSDPSGRKFPLVMSAAAALIAAGIAVAGYHSIQEPIEAPLALKSSVVEPPPDPVVKPPPPAPPPPEPPPPPASAEPEDDVDGARASAHRAKEELDRFLAEKPCPKGIIDGEHALRLQGKWSVADAMYAKGEKRVAFSYYRELEEITRGIHETCRAAEQTLATTAPETAQKVEEPQIEAQTAPDPEPPRDNKQAKTHYQRALALKEKGALDRAIKELDRAIAIAPDFVAALNSRGLLHQKKGRYDAALADFDRALALADDNPAIHYNRAQVRIIKRDSFGALADLDRAIELDPQNARYFESRANVHTLRDNPEKTAEDLARAIALDPSRIDLRLRRARTLVALDHHADAVTELNEIIEKKPSGEAHFLRGTALLELKKLDAAIADFTATLERDPSHERALLQRGIARAMVDDKKEAIADLERFLVIAPTSKHRSLAKKWLSRLQ